MKRFLPILLIAASTLFVSCEPMDAVDPFGLIHDDDEKSESDGQSQSPANNSSSEDKSQSLSGTWKGRSATSQVSTTLRLSENGGSISGSLTWPGGDKRSVSGSRSGSSVTLHIGGGDTWHLSYSGNSMKGTGHKAGGGTYNLSFTRK